MKKRVIAVGVVIVGALAYAGHRYIDARTKAKYPSIHQKSEVESKPLSDELYRKGIDTILINKNDTFFLKDLSDVFNFVVANTDSHAHTHDHGHNYEYWQFYLSKPHPSIGTIRRYFKEVSDEFNVPVGILHAIGQIENNWTQIGPSIDQGWGIMHLVDNHYCNTLLEAAQILNISPQVLKDDAYQNIRGAAALLAKYAGENRTEFSSYEEWYPAMKKFSGLINDQIQSIQLEEYTRVLYKGSTSITLWGEEIVLHPQPKIYSK